MSTAGEKMMTIAGVSKAGKLAWWEIKEQNFKISEMSFDELKLIKLPQKGSFSKERGKEAFRRAWKEHHSWYRLLLSLLSRSPSFTSRYYF